MVPTKSERFEKWRASAAADETKYIVTANAFDAFIQDVIRENRGLAVIKTVLANHLSTIYTTKDIHTNKDTELSPTGRYTQGAIIYCKLSVDEALETLGKFPSMPSNERTILNNLSDVLDALYLNPKHNTEQNIVCLFENAEAFLRIKPETYADKDKAIALYHSLYATFTIMHTVLIRFNWSDELVAKPFITTKTVKTGLNVILDAIETKLALLNAATTDASSTAQSSVVPKTIQDYLNDRHLALFNPNDHDIAPVICKLKASMDEIMNGIARLMKAKNEKRSIELEIEQVTALLKKFTDNDARIHGREYFFDLVKDDPAYVALMQTSTGAIKERLVTNIAQLTDQSPYTSAAQSVMGWAFGPATKYFRRLAPTAVQDALKAIAPDTADSACKNTQKELLRESLNTLKDRLGIAEENIDSAATTVSGENAALKQRLINESVAELARVADANKAVMDALDECGRLYTSVKDKMVILDTMRDSSATLKKYVKEYNGIGVIISNFLAKYMFFLFSKSDTAKMIDAALAMQKDFAALVEGYSNVIGEHMDAINDNTHVPDDIKVNLHINFIEGATGQAAEAPESTHTKQAARAVIDNFQKNITFFKSRLQRPEPVERMMRHPAP